MGKSWNLNLERIIKRKKLRCNHAMFVLLGVDVRAVKELVLRSNVEIRVGSNPTPRILFFYTFL